MEKFKCPAIDCKSQFTRQFNLNRHYERFHINNDMAEKCLLCGTIYQSCQELQKHYRRVHKPTKNFVLKESAFKKSVATYRYTFPENSLDFRGSQQRAMPTILNLLFEEAVKKTLIKVSMIYICEMSMLDHVGDKMQTTLIPFRAPAFLVSGYSKQNLKQNVQKSFMLQEQSMEEFCNAGSNWVFDRAIAYDLEIATMRPVLVGGDDPHFYKKNDVLNIKNIVNNKFLYNPKNTDEKCFLYCVYEHLRSKSTTFKNRKMTFKQFERKLNLQNITFPISILQVKRFCKQNSFLKLRINILLRNTKNHIFPLEYGIGESKSAKTLNLLLVQRKKRDSFDTKNHFLLIKDLHKFLRPKYANHSYKKSFSCSNCLNTFSSTQVLEKHESICCLNKPRVEIVAENPEMMFKSYHKSSPQEYIAFLDFECILPKSTKPCDECSHLRCKCDKSFTETVSEQYPVTYSLVILDQKCRIIHENTYSGEDAAVHLVDHLIEQEEIWLKNLFTTQIQIRMTDEDIKNYEKSDKCYMCQGDFEEEPKCHDHCHFTGKYLGAACQQCNLLRRRPKQLNIFLHNGSKYDFHFIIKALNNKPKVTNINILPYNGENFRTISFNSFLFVDSMSFLQSSLSQLSEDLSKTKNPYSILRQTYLVKTNECFDRSKFKMVLGKSFFPYEFCTSFDLMLKTKTMPKREHFYSSLSEEIISEDDYNFACKVWKKFKCKNLIDYAELYCKIDTILLAEIFQKFRKDMLKFSGLDPARYISLPSFAFDSMLKITKCRLELPTDIDVVQFIEKGIRGGVSFVNTRYLSCNNSNEKIHYIDANNLYGHAQTSLLPYDNFKWLELKIADKVDWSKINTEGKNGFILEVDLQYPSHLHELHSNFPLAPENIELDYENLSPFAKKSLYRSTQNKKYSDIKLSATYHDRKNYVLHFKNLKLYLSLGMKLTCIHRVLKFRQKNFIEPFIELCTIERQKAKTKFEQDQFKKVANSTYGKTIQNVRNYSIVKLHTTKKSLLKAIAHHTFKNFVILDDYLVQTNHFKPVICHDRPIAVGMSILELSKHTMYSFFYNYLIDKKFTIDLGFSDTDSFLFKTNNTEEYEKKIKKLMDFSNYPKEHKLYSTENKAKLGFFKDELGGKLSVTEFVGLRSKCYSLNMKEKETLKKVEKKVCKGLGRVAIDKRLKFKHYKNCLFKYNDKRFDFATIRSTKQNVRTVRINKRAISHFESKRWLFDCGIHSEPYGSILIDKFYNRCPKCK
jgi:hypothetical protein